MSTEAPRIDWQWSVNVFPHRAHDEAVSKLLELLAEGLVLEVGSIPSGCGNPHNDAYAVQRACERLQAANAAFRADRDAQDKIRGYYKGLSVGLLQDRVVKTVAEAFTRESAGEKA
jgi:hypothetical protein